MEGAFFNNPVHRNASAAPRGVFEHDNMAALLPVDVKTGALEDLDAHLAGNLRELGHTATASISTSISGGTNSLCALRLSM